MHRRSERKNAVFVIAEMLLHLMEKIHLELYHLMTLLEPTFGLEQSRMQRSILILRSSIVPRLSRGTRSIPTTTEQMKSSVYRDNGRLHTNKIQ